MWSSLGRSRGIARSARCGSIRRFCWSRTEFETCIPEATGTAGPGGRKGGEDSLDTYSLISRVPGLRGKGEILSLSGNQISSVMAGAQALTDPSIAKMLVSKLRKPGGALPRYFQVVLRVRSMDGVPTEITYMFHRELTVTKPPAPPEK